MSMMFIQTDKGLVSADSINAEKSKTTAKVEVKKETKKETKAIAKDSKTTAKAK